MSRLKARISRALASMQVSNEKMFALAAGSLVVALYKHVPVMRKFASTQM